MRTIQTDKIVLSTVLCACLSLPLFANGTYDVTLLDHAECNPVAENDRPSGGMKENRRVDVTVDVYEEEHELIEEKSKIVTKAYLDNGGVIWATSDPLIVKSRLDVKTHTSATLSGNKLASPITFITYNNYSDYVERYELLIVKQHKNGILKPIKLLEGKSIPKEITWHMNPDDNIALNQHESLHYALRVYDKEGRFDETKPRLITLSNKTEDRSQNLEAEIYGKSNLKSRSIPINGTKVRVHGQGISPQSILRIGEKDVLVDQEGKFVYEDIKSYGTHTIPVHLMNAKGEQFAQELAIDVKKNHLFMVGLADFTMGQNNVSGNIKPLEADEHYNEDIFVDGRIAFYAKGKIQGKYLLTAQMDTQEHEIKDMFKDIHKKDPKSMFRNLDPDRFYTVYGDDSTSYNDTDSQGKLYLSLEWDNSKALWGNYNTGITGTEFANVNRSLYGAKFKHSSLNMTKYGDHKRDIIIFASEAQSAYAHNEFEGTGGSLYYLKNVDILEGSEKVWVEIRERNSERVAEKIELVRGKDYEIDELQGRIILTRPLSPFSKASGPSIIKDKPLDGNRVLLKVDYEYVPNDFNTDKATYGARGKQWLGNFLAVGATYAHEGRSDDDYEVSGVDVTLRSGRNTFIKAEYAQSESLQSNGANFRSTDGGLGFSTLENNNTNSDGSALGVEAMISLADFDQFEHDGTLSMWYKKRESGFSSARLGSSKEVTDYGFETQSQINQRLCLTGRGTVLEQGSQKESTISVEAGYNTEKYELGAEIRSVKEENGTRLNDEGTLAGVRAKYNFNSFFGLYVAAQTTLDNTGNYKDNDLITLGTDIHYKKLTLDASASSGDRGTSVQLGADYAYSDTQSFYGTYTLSTDSTEGERDIFTVGQRSKVTNALNVFTEHQFSHSDRDAGIGHAFGIDYAFNKYLIANLVYNQIDLDNGRDRDSFSTSLNYSDEKIKASTKLEYRVDKDAVSEVRQYLTVNRLSYKLNPAMRLMGKLNYSRSLDKVQDLDNAKFIEGGVGFAYRPVENTRFNLIGKYTYLYDLLSSAQDSTRANEKAHIISAEMSYQLSPRWTIGHKLGYKKHQTQISRNSGDWYANELKLAALRVNYHIIKDWDAMFEGHMLSQKDDGTKKGILVALYKHIGENMKVGVG